MKIGSYFPFDGLKPLQSIARDLVTCSSLQSPQNVTQYLLDEPHFLEFYMFYLCYQSLITKI